MERTIRKGSTVLLTRGEYSSYGVIAVAVAERDVDIEAERDAWLALHPEDAAEYKFHSMRFVAWLMTTGVLREIPYFEWYLTGYDRIEEMDLTVVAPIDRAPHLGENDDG